MENMGLTEKDALTLLYSSKLYEQLDKEETKLWHLSVPHYSICSARNRKPENHIPGGGVIMDEKTNFIVYCIEEYKNAMALTGKAVIDLFNQYRVIDYIRSYYEALHTTGRQYIVDDINLYINARQPV
jgi:hypothetical protein